MEGYYFITYMFQRKTFGKSDYENDVINVHPLDWVIEKNKNDEEFFHVIMFYKEITKEQYDKGWAEM